MFAHLPLALATQLVIWGFGMAMGVPDVASVWLGFLAGCAVCLMREITQQEYRWIERFGAGRRANMPVLAGLRFWEWNGHSKRETLCACAVTFIIATVVTIYSAT